jgi:hypothetical protein
MQSNPAKSVKNQRRNQEKGYNDKIFQNHEAFYHEKSQTVWKYY